MILFSRLSWDFSTVLKMVAVFVQIYFSKIISSWLAKQKRLSTSVLLDLFYKVAVPKKNWNISQKVSMVQSRVNKVTG